MANEIKASEGKVWKSKVDGAYLSDTLILGNGDTLENYEEVDPPVYTDEDVVQNE